MIVRDEEETLAGCLDSIKDIVDEIIIVDTGSQDKTKEIACRYTSNIYDFQWIDDFSAARNYSFSKATKEFILWLDADDAFLEEDRNKLKVLKEQLDPSIDIVMLRYIMAADETGEILLTCYRERLLKRNLNFEWYDPVHEYILPTGRIASTDIAVTHKKLKQNSSRNLKIFEKMLKEGRKLSHRNYFYFAKELNANGRYEDAKIYYNKFLDQEGGFFSNYMEACIDLSRIYTLEGDRKAAIIALLKCFEYGMPRAEICCELGRQYKELNDFESAVSWFKMAAAIDKPENTIGSVIYDCYNYIPCIELSICYFMLGKLKEAVLYNERAAEYKPGSSTVTDNRSYFETLIRAAKMMD
jgi:glycosyltransferase involved in cell wall biosynthesis